MKRVALVLLFCASTAWAAGYVSNAFEVSSDKGEVVLSNRDLECVSVSKNTEGAYVGKFWVNPVANKSLKEFTAKHKGETMPISICGTPPMKPVIRASIGSPFDVMLTEEQKKCLEDSFYMRKPCRDCPVCKQ
ncbi:MAG: hypothetical protein V1495_10635 [Pseudomonadota bacterium]